MSEKLIEHFEKEKNYDEVIKIIDELILEDPEKASSLLFRKAEALVGLEKYQQAITTLKVYAKDCPNNEKIKSYVLIASCYMNLDNDEKAEEYLVKILEIDPENDIILRQFARLYFRRLVHRCLCCC